MGPEVFQFFRAIGLNLKQVYGQTETSGICVLHPDDEVRGETVGKATPGTQVRISDTGEILIKCDSVFLGYYKNPEATATALENGWLHTGDAGCWMMRVPCCDRPACGRFALPMACASQRSLKNKLEV